MSDAPRLEAIRYDDGTISCPGHDRGRRGGTPVERIDLTDLTGTIVTWTSSTAPPPGVRSPNHLAIVEFSLDDGSTVRTIGQLTTSDVSIGEKVRTVYVDQLRDPEAGIRLRASQEWDGYRFEPITE